MVDGVFWLSCTVVFKGARLLNSEKSYHFRKGVMSKLSTKGGTKLVTRNAKCAVSLNHYEHHMRLRLIILICP